jgi:hypothetical protein
MWWWCSCAPENKTMTAGFKRANALCFAQIIHAMLIIILCIVSALCQCRLVICAAKIALAD